MRTCYEGHFRNLVLIADDQEMVRIGFRMILNSHDVVKAAARGLTNTEIGAELFLSLSTVKTHLASVQGKIGARNRVETAAWAWRNGIMD